MRYPFIPRWEAEQRAKARKQQEGLLIAAYYSWALIAQARYGEHPVEVRRKCGIAQALEE